jgi:glucose-6-phosphate 1-epimerase
MDINQLNANFGIPGQIDFINGSGNLPFIKVYNPCATALVSLLGGQILSYKPVTESDDMFFLGKLSAYEDGTAIRGGIPVCWPWFGPDPKGLHRPNHGFVRNHFWRVVQTASTPTETTITLQFSDSQKAERTWKHPFTLLLTLNIGETLSLQLTTHNSGGKPFAITQAFHTYFNVSNINRIQVLGLEDCRYFDKLDQGKEKQQTGSVMITGAVDRIYEDIDNHVMLNDPGFNRRIEVNSQHCRTGVVWNPWTKAMTDLEPDDYQRFVCVETGNIAFDLIQIPPGGEHRLLTNFRIVHL